MEDTEFHWGLDVFGLNQATPIDQSGGVCPPAGMQPKFR